VTGGPVLPAGPERNDPAFVADELRMLDAWLDFHRATLLTKSAGLDGPQLRARAVPPSTLSLLGLVRHMAEVERNWFRNVLADEGAPPLFYSDDFPDGDFDLVDDADAGADLATFHAEVDHARALTATAGSLDDIGRRQRRGEDVSLRWILVHMIEEYARHNGHADLLRQCVDGTVGE
jgi:hypothetical protein